jgi:hypothetical protein
LRQLIIILPSPHDADVADNVGSEDPSCAG